jgi:hypothetical protein
MDRTYGVVGRVVLLAAMLAVPLSAPGAETYWRGKGGNWTDAGKWDNGVPGPEDDVYVDGSGTALIQGGDAAAGTLYLGCYGTGTVNHTAGSNTITGSLSMGTDYGTAGTYQLSGTGQLSAGYEEVGVYGTGTIVHTGGTNTAGEQLSLGMFDESKGTYQLSGTGNLSAGWQWIGVYGQGTFVHSGGTNTADLLFVVGAYKGGRGSYELSGTGALSAANQIIGLSGVGTFVQRSGANTGSDTLYVGYSTDGSGTYTLIDGQMSTKELHIGTTGRLTQSGGSAKADALFLDGPYDLTGGTLSSASVQGALVNKGGTFAPGESVGITKITGSYTQQSGALEIDILGQHSGTEYDVLSVTGQVSLGGVLRVLLDSGFHPQYGDRFQVLTGSSVTGRFQGVEGAHISPDMCLAVLYQGNAVVLVAAAPGDANLDGKVDTADLAALEGHFGQPGACWSDGDVNQDGQINEQDYLAIKSRFSDGTGGQGQVPEPACLSVLALGGLALLRRRLARLPRPGRLSCSAQGAQ